MLINGHRNRSVGKVLLLLCWRHDYWHSNAGLPVAALAYNSGVSKVYIKGKIKKWLEWRYVSRELCGDCTGQASYRYKLLVKGRNAIVNQPQRIISELYSEIMKDTGGKSLVKRTG
jgi:hypothetical protein